MEQFRELMSYLKMYRPGVLATGTEYTPPKKIALTRKAQSLEDYTVYVGYVSDMIHLLRFHENRIFFLILDSSGTLPDDYHGNFCISFPEDTNVEYLLAECRKYFDVQSELYEYSHILMETYLSDPTLDAVISKAERMIDNPIMVIDSNYRVICESGNESCGDVVWCENIKNGYCSYEFVTQFNQISKIRNIHPSDDAFMAGCLNSPLRRCICKLRTHNYVIGYLLAIELNSPFNELKMQILSLVSRLVPRMMSESGAGTSDGSALQITDLFSDMLSGKLKSEDVLKNCLQYSHIPLESDYYLVSVNIKDYKLLENSASHSLELALAKIVDYILSTCVETNIIFLVESKKALADITQTFLDHLEFFKKSRLTVGISDHFKSLEDLSAYYNQTNFVHNTVRQLKLEGKIICTYDNLRIMDIIAHKPTLDNYLYLVGQDIENIHQYDEKHDTEYFKTLYYYVRWNRNLKMAAEILCVHKNTVSYRVQRAKELFHLDLNDFHTDFHLYVGYLIYLMKDNHALQHDGED